MKRVRIQEDEEWDGVCACGKAALDGKRCRLGATHERLKRRQRIRIEPDDEQGDMFE